MRRGRAKRQYEAQRRFTDRVNNARLAIGLLINQQEGLNVSSSVEDLSTNFTEGGTLLKELRQALLVPAAASDYIVRLAQSLVDRWGVEAEIAADRLEESITALRRAKTGQATLGELEETRSLLDDITEIAGRATESEASGL